VNNGEANARVVIRALSAWEVLINGERVSQATVIRYRILHALVLGDGQVMREDMFELLGWDHSDQQHAARFKQHVHMLRKKLGVHIDNASPISLTIGDDVYIDLWRFMRLAGDEHHTRDAARLIMGGKRPALLAPNLDEDHGLWSKMFTQFDAVVTTLTKTILQLEAGSAPNRRAYPDHARPRPPSPLPVAPQR